MKRRLHKSLEAANRVSNTPLPWARGARRNAMIARRITKSNTVEKQTELKLQQA